MSVPSSVKEVKESSYGLTIYAPQKLTVKTTGEPNEFIGKIGVENDPDEEYHYFKSDDNKGKINVRTGTIKHNYSKCEMYIPEDFHHFIYDASNPSDATKIRREKVKMSGKKKFIVNIRKGDSSLPNLINSNGKALNNIAKGFIKAQSFKFDFHEAASPLADLSNDKIEGSSCECRYSLTYGESKLKIFCRRESVNSCRSNKKTWIYYIPTLGKKKSGIMDVCYFVTNEAVMRAWISQAKIGPSNQLIGIGVHYPEQIVTRTVGRKKLKVFENPLHMFPHYNSIAIMQGFFPKK